MPEYWELQAKKHAFKGRMDLFVGEGKLKQFKDQKQQTLDMLKSSQDKLFDLTGERDEWRPYAYTRRGREY